MTNKELRNILERYPDDAEVWIIDRKNDITPIAAPERGQFLFGFGSVPYHKDDNAILICVDERFE